MWLVLQQEVGVLRHLGRHVDHDGGGDQGGERRLGDVEPVAAGDPVHRGVEVGAGVLAGVDVVPVPGRALLVVARQLRELEAVGVRERRGQLQDRGGRLQRGGQVDDVDGGEQAGQHGHGGACRRAPSKSAVRAVGLAATVPPMGPRIVVVGAGFAGLTAARGLLRRLGDAAEVTVIDTKDHFLYLPLLPEVTTGVVEPRHIAVSLARALPGARLVLATVDTDRRRRPRRRTGRTPTATGARLAYDRLVLTVGSVNRLLPIPGVADHAHGYRGIAEALYLRDHLVRQVELAAAPSPPTARPAARSSWSGRATPAPRWPRRARGSPRSSPRPTPRCATSGCAGCCWTPPTAGAARAAPAAVAHGRPGAAGAGRRGAHRRVRGRGPRRRVRLTGGEDVPMRTLVWCVGVRPDPLVDDLGLKTERGRLVVDPYLAVPDHPEILACGRRRRGARPHPARPASPR